MSPQALYISGFITIEPLAKHITLQVNPALSSGPSKWQTCLYVNCTHHSLQHIFCQISSSSSLVVSATCHGTSPFITLAPPTTLVPLLSERGPQRQTRLKKSVEVKLAFFYYQSQLYLKTASNLSFLLSFTFHEIVASTKLNFEWHFYRDPKMGILTSTISGRDGSYWGVATEKRKYCTKYFLEDSQEETISWFIGSQFLDPSCNCRMLQSKNKRLKKKVFSLVEIRKMICSCKIYIHKLYQFPP
jgi:hypothetical protein